MRLQPQQLESALDRVLRLLGVGQKGLPGWMGPNAGVTAPAVRATQQPRPVVRPAPPVARGPIAGQVARALPPRPVAPAPRPPGPVMQNFSPGYTPDALDHALGLVGMQGAPEPVPVWDKYRDVQLRGGTRLATPRPGGRNPFRR